MSIRGLTGTPSVEIVPNKGFTEKRQGDVSPMCRKKRLKKSPTPSSSTFSSTSIEDLGIEPQYLDMKSEEGASSAAETPQPDAKDGFCYNGFQNIADNAPEKVEKKFSSEIPNFSCILMVSIFFSRLRPKIVVKTLIQFLRCL